MPRRPSVDQSGVPKGFKVCRACRTQKPHEEFYKLKSSPDGLHPECKSCCKLARAADRVHKRDKKSKISNRQNYRAKQMDLHVEGEEITLKKLYIRDKGICGICGKPVPSKQASPDHIKPLGKGGTHTWDNIQLAHVSCNKSKKDTYQE